MDRSNKVSAAFRDVFVLLDDNSVSHWDGKNWTNTDLPTNSLVRGIWGFNPKDIFAVGVGATVLHYNGNEWEEFNNLHLDRFNSYSDIWGISHNNLFIAGDMGEVYRYDGEYLVGEAQLEGNLYWLDEFNDLKNSSGANINSMITDGEGTVESFFTFEEEDVWLYPNKLEIAGDGSVYLGKDFWKS